MSAATLIRWSGLATILAGLLVGLFPLLHPNHDPDSFRSPIWIIAHLLPHVAVVLTLFGLIGVFVRQFSPAGWLGLIGFLTAFVGTALILTQALVELFIMPFIGLEVPHLMEGPPPPGLDAAFMLMAVLFSLGYVLLGIAIMRAGVLPRGVGLLLAISAPVFMLGIGPVGELFGTEALFRVSGVLFGAALMWLGYSLRVRTGETREARGIEWAMPVPPA